MSQTTEAELIRRIKTLSERLWEGRCQIPDLHDWLDNFDGRHCVDAETERLQALNLLASVSYFGLRELRVLLRSMFRDLLRYPIIQEIRERLGGSRDSSEVGREFAVELEATRFIGMGNPAESGTHLLYYFRQENRLPRHLFIHQHELLSSAATDPSSDFALPDLKRVVFIDDLCGSGEQSVRYSRTVLRDLREVGKRRNQEVTYHYLVLFGTDSGMKRAKQESDFDVVAAVNEVDSIYLTFGPDSRVFRKPSEGIDKSLSESVARGYGAELWPRWPLGYEDGQLLLAFHHNVPDNSLPILWFDEGDPAWTPAFPRQPKVN